MIERIEFSILHFVFQNVDQDFGGPIARGHATVNTAFHVIEWMDAVTVCQVSEVIDVNMVRS